MGGSVGLKGTDGNAWQQAKALGAQQRANARANVALKQIADGCFNQEIYCYSGEMGGDAVTNAGLRAHIIGNPALPSTFRDTKNAAQSLLKENIDLLLFVGGDGTARDIESVINLRIPVIGIPAGVKMHSAVFANSPNQAGQLAVKFLRDEVARCNRLEVMDIDEARYRQGQISASLFGYLQVPYIQEFIQGPKSAIKNSEEKTTAIAQTIIEGMDNETIYLIGPGTTSKAIMKMLLLEYTLIGVDVIQNKKLLALDANEAKILDLVTDKPAMIIVSIIGGQGFVLGRGNQQLSSRVVQTVGTEKIVVVATQEKLVALSGKPLKIDLNDPDCESSFPQYMKVITGYNETTVYPISVV